ncbi:hypothetical protein COT78_01040 [Candidatus Berkelbacteria bacterium CG10_big_fil_rev_8_21_14_0_10_43_13]|uniref:Uncharacterized protein n=1 Tax=Candidatus Berkelbacteria bacterium CG10_big_fil_rev_8_21_14_0_10_43_13 TaxID=1974514 RepID=A0A2H0W776_9BACT|nr:MAG: hypothetical protein COT78_01040 [Candidatus Berkelbacteria bacterium CG10_big_fil_rev_8_21_14_0_10_43_13]
MLDENQKNDQITEKPSKSRMWLVVVLIFIVLGLGGYFAFTGRPNKSKSNVPITGSNGNKSSTSTDSADVRWMMASDGTYSASSTPPDCPTPLVLPLPTDISKVVSVLYPGQYRGDNYKPHGGFRFDDGSNNQTVVAPLDAIVIDGSRYLVDGEIQYTFDFINSCGIKYRLGHLRTLSPTFSALADKFPAAQEMDSRTTLIDQPVKITASDTIATAVGLLSANNAFFDYGVYDLRQANEISKGTVFQTAHSDDKDLSWHGICWLDFLSSTDTAIIQALPATSPGSMSDYCAGSAAATTSSSPIPAVENATSTSNSPTNSSNTSGSSSGSGTGGGR